MTRRSRKRTKDKKVGKVRTRNRDAQPSLQPTQGPGATVPCRICGHPVLVQRMHFHMVRFHGEAFRSKAG